MQGGRERIKHREREREREKPKEYDIKSGSATDSRESIEL